MTAKEFLYTLPEKANKGVLNNVDDTTFHFDLDGDGGGQFTMKLRDGQLSLEEGLNEEAKCVVKAKTDNFMGLATGKLNPMMALLMGKVKITNQGEMLKYAKVLGLM